MSERVNEMTHMDGPEREPEREAERKAELDALARLLDSHGGDGERWPAAERMRFATLLAQDERARRLVREAQALDALLDLAPTVAASRRRELQARLMNQVREGDGPAPATASVIDFAPRGTHRPPSGVGLPMRARSGPLAAAALMAASLVLGVMVGASGWGLTAADSRTEVADSGLSIPGLLDDDMNDPDNEDIL